jgi:hypothetical protein
VVALKTVNLSTITIGFHVMKLSSIPVVKLPLVDVSTDPLDLMVTGLALRMKQLARTSPKFIELVHERQFRIQIGTDLGMARQIIVNNGQIDTVPPALGTINDPSDIQVAPDLVYTATLSPVVHSIREPGSESLA